ncbi:eukaryotic translation initiation factor 3 subunit 6 [Phakopsora pachyrhizi]|nr:eukaryotic translation initiation factor 3 subunit 6 [Phakopsora pachyrhizi]
MSFQPGPVALERQYYSDEEDDFYEQGAQQQLLLLQAAAVAHQQAQEAVIALAAVPEPVRKYIVYLHNTLLSSNPQEILAFYQKTEWPESEIIAPLVNNDEVFLLFYRELYYRHWLWDIIDKFIYQFTSFTTWKGKIARKTKEEIQLIAENPQVWACYSVLNVHYSLITRSKIHDQLVAVKKGENPEAVSSEWGSCPLYQMLGYFSIIGLLRVHVLLGDYTLALPMMDDKEFNKKAFLLVKMRRKYPDAIRALAHVLYFLQGLKGYHTRGYQFEAVNESITSTMKEKHSEQYSKMIQGEEASLAAFEELFTFASPKYLSLSSPPYDRPELLPQYVATSSLSKNLSTHNLGILIADIKTQLPSPNSRSFLKLYTKLGVHKLAGFLYVDEDEVLESLMVLTGLLRSLKRPDGDYGLLEGKEVALDRMVVDGDIIIIVETNPGRRFNKYFMRHCEKACIMFEQLMMQPLPSPHSCQAAMLVLVLY